MKIQKLSRRDFLKLASLASLGTVAPRKLVQQSEKPNIIVVVFDAWSAMNIGMYGYSRQTMPKLEKLAEKAIVYHNHYAAGTWTIPGTSSLLSGTYPWTHHCVSMDLIQLATPKHNLFRLLKEAGYATVAATHNMYADIILSQFERSLTMHPHFSDMFLPSMFPFTNLFRKDIEVTSLSQKMTVWNTEQRFQSSIFFGEIFRKLIEARLDRINQTYGDQFPRGVPMIPVLNMPFLLEDGIDHLLKTAQAFSRPQMTYYHYYPPHQPYYTRAEFYNAFKEDEAHFPEKPDSYINEGHRHPKVLQARQEYDETLMYVDAEFDRLYHSLEESGQLENTWLILTSDHGELFERANIGHEVPIGYEALSRVPLLIFPPGQESRVDIHATTGAVDLMPTLLHLAGQPVPDWAEGFTLPPFGNSREKAGEAVFTVHGWLEHAKAPFVEGAVTMVQDGMKLIFTFRDHRVTGSDHMIELYDLAADPEELDNLFTDDHPVGKPMFDEIMSRLDQADQQFA